MDGAVLGIFLLRLNSIFSSIVAMVNTPRNAITIDAKTICDSKPLHFKDEKILCIVNVYLCRYL
jgi:hypothetical protein